VQQKPFDRAVLHVLESEGGYSDDPADSGGKTNFGISQAQYPNIDIKRLTRDEAITFYWRDYWEKYRCGDFPWPLGFILFDSVVQFNPARPVKWLQAAVGGVMVDGILGPETVQAADAVRDPVRAAARMMAERGEYRTTRSNYHIFGKGWRFRDFAVLAEAVRGEE
jgi:lysozyme family protein